MVGQKSPSVTAGLCLGKNSRQPIDQVLAIFIVIEYFPAFYPPDYDMLQKTGRIYAGYSAHA